ncbi:hypothetical protein mRhiFer1_008888 [Rhinolophus ferrumequinum]|uniref:Uncharacterized protein n=1 Tax=Rhinolophus ferrumequinum TaxID=59479 RepID=A0A7J7TEP4_RHIFE|nr:hypothetical protein mRhiFer1_008888 [Rhinolophus ferrumequinum]
MLLLCLGPSQRLNSLPTPSPPLPSPPLPSPRGLLPCHSPETPIPSSPHASLRLQVPSLSAPLFNFLFFIKISREKLKSLYSEHPYANHPEPTLTTSPVLSHLRDSAALPSRLPLVHFSMNRGCQDASAELRMPTLNQSLFVFRCFFF